MIAVTLDIDAPTVSLLVRVCQFAVDHGMYLADWRDRRDLLNTANYLRWICADDDIPITRSARRGAN
jgi:hypothetical protein